MPTLQSLSPLPVIVDKIVAREREEAEVKAERELDGDSEVSRRANKNEHATGAGGLGGGLGGGAGAITGDQGGGGSSVARAREIDDFGDRGWRRDRGRWRRLERRDRFQVVRFQVAELPHSL